MTNSEAEKVGRLVGLILENRYARAQLVKRDEFTQVVTMLEPRLMEVVNVYAERVGRKAAERVGRKAAKRKGMAGVPAQ